MSAPTGQSPYPTSVAPYAATVADVTSDHGPFSPRVLTKRVDHSSAPPGQSGAGETVFTPCARGAWDASVATRQCPGGARTGVDAMRLSGAAGSYAATVALAVSPQGPVAPLVLTQRER